MADTVITIPNNFGLADVQVLSAEQTRQTGFTHAFIIPAAVIAAVTGGTTGDTVTVALGSTPPRFMVTRALIDVTTAFTTLSTGTLTASLGISTSTAVYVAAQSMLTAGPKAVTAGFVPAGATSTAGAAAVTLSARFTTGTAGAPSDVATGSVTFFLAIVDLTVVGG